jgi:hypothetical protein
VSHRVFDISVASVYVHYVNKVERKDRTEDELIEVIKWLTGFEKRTLKKHLKDETTFRDFFKAAKITWTSWSMSLPRGDQSRKSFARISRPVSDLRGLKFDLRILRS